MSLKTLLEELQREYLESIPTKIANIQLLWRERRLDDLQTEFHKLKGTGRTYGLAEISQLGEALGTICERREGDLETAVRLGATLLSRIRNARDSGAPIALEDDVDFQVLVQFVLEG